MVFLFLTLGDYPLSVSVLYYRILYVRFSQELFCFVPQTVSELSQDAGTYGQSYLYIHIFVYFRTILPVYQSV